jgi:hypothetical protein
MRVHLARLGLNAHEDAPVAALERLARLDRIGDHKVADAASADVIVFPQCHMLSRDWRLDTIRQSTKAETVELYRRAKTGLDWL